MPYRVTYAIDSLDPNPLVKEFEDEWDASEWLLEEIQSRIDYQIQHSPYPLSEDEVDSLHEIETSLASIERV
jgi:hypothetical protein